MVEPDVEAALRAVRRTVQADAGRRSTRTRPFLAAAAAIAVIGGGVFAVTRGDDGPSELVVADGDLADEPAPTTTVPVSPDNPPTTLESETADPDVVSAKDVPAPSQRLTGGDAVQVEYVLGPAGDDEQEAEPFVFTEIWADDGTAYAINGPASLGDAEPRPDDTLAARRTVLTSSDWTLGEDRFRNEMLQAGGFETADEAEQNDRLWDDGWDLLASVTLDDDEWTATLGFLEQQLGARLFLNPDSTDRTLVIVWDGHSDGEERQLVLNAATGAPIGYLAGNRRITYTVERINLSDLTIIEPMSDAPAVALDGEGLRAIDPSTGSTSLVAFGTPGELAITLLTGAFGDPSGSSEANECGRGPTDAVNWGGLSIAIDAADDTFVGWSIADTDNAPVITTIDGLGIGSTVAELQASRTVEFADGGTLGPEYVDATSSWLTTGTTDEDTVAAILTGENCAAR